MIELTQISLYRYQNLVLRNVSFCISQGEHVVISGRNGVGKTSLLDAIKGRLPLRKGRITFNIDLEPDETIFDWKRKYIQSVSFADSNRLFLNKERYYQQRFHAFDSDDISVSEYLASLGFESSNSEHLRLIHRFNIAQLLPVSRVKLSSGQTRRLLIITALLAEPKLLLLDNPYVGLDESNRHLLNQLLDEISQSTEITIILAGFYTSLPSCVRSEIILNSTGAIKGEPKSEMIAERPENRPSIDPIIIDYFRDTDHWPKFQTCLSLDQISIGYPDKQILKDFSLHINKGEKWTILGENGAGKSTLIGLISADHPQAYTNDIILFDQSRGTIQNIWDVKEKIGFLSSELHAYFHDPEWTCYDIVRQGYYVSMYARRTLSATEEGIIEAVFRYFNKSALRSQKYSQCSTGEQRIVLFMRAIIKNPPMLLLDEPFQCLDSEMALRAKFLLESILTKDHSMIFITHYQHEIPSIMTHDFELKTIE